MLVLGLSYLLATEHWVKLVRALTVLGAVLVYATWLAR
jgi:hypothetical protein